MVIIFCRSGSKGSIMPKVIYLLLSFVAVAHSNQHLPPALVWGAQINAPLGQVQSTPENVAGTMPSDNIVIFMLDKLSLEDFENFPNVKKVVAEHKSVFFPEVESERLVDYLRKEKNVQVMFMNSFEDVEKAVLKVNFDKRIGMLTARKSSWKSRSKRAVEAGPPVYVGPDHLIYLKQVKLLINQHGTTIATFPYSQAKSVTTEMIANETVVKYSFEGGSSEKLNVATFVLEMRLKRRGGYYSVTNYTATVDGTHDGNSLKLEDIMKSSVDLLFPASTSFHCTKFGPLSTLMVPIKGVEKRNVTASVIFEKFQIQIGKNDTFWPVYECVGFFTPGIWMGIFMNIILLSIITWGIYMIMSVKTMDRFDDPKGKPISFGGTE